MRISTVQIVLFRILRRANAQHKSGRSACSASEAGETSKTVGTAGKWRGAKMNIQGAYAALNQWLACYYKLCGRIGLDLPINNSQIICLGENEVLRLTRESRVKHLKVEQGIVWLTGTPATGDTLLQHGDCFVLEKDWPFVVQAIGPARIILVS